MAYRRRRRRQRVVVEDRISITPVWPRVVDLLHRSADGGVLLVSLRSWSIHRLNWDDLGDASSSDQGDGR